MPYRKDADSSEFRQSCESCRRKKTKCPAEKPVCSVCRRLNQTCVYLPRRRGRPQSGQAYRTNNRSVTSNATVIRSKPHGLRNRLSNTPESGVASENQAKRYLNDPHQSGDFLVRPTLHARQNDTPELPTGISQEIIEVYKSKIHFQPLPLFDADSLEERTKAFPTFLSHSFLALTLSFIEKEQPAEQEEYDGEGHADAARATILERAANGSSSLEVQQAMCLLVLHDIMNGLFAQAWMMVGQAARLQALREATSFRHTRSLSDFEADSRCYWSIFILEKMISPQSSQLQGNLPSARYLRSPVRPPPPASLGGKSRCLDLSDAHETNNSDRGFIEYTLKMIGLWGDIVAHLREIRAGKTDAPWMTSSKHAHFTAQIFEFEMNLSPVHLLRHVEFADRTSSEIERDQQYWTPWILMQISMHAALALLNNPFVHLVRFRDSENTSRPRTFLQNTVDQALFNARWVFRLLQMCEALEYRIFDPLIAQMVSATATIPWLFQFARDEKVSRSCRTDLQNFETFLSQLAPIWPQVSKKLEIMQGLQIAVENQGSGPSNDPTMVSFQPGKLWDLLTLDSNLPRLEALGNRTPSDARAADLDENATLHVTTQFIHPIAEMGDAAVSSQQLELTESTMKDAGSYLEALDDVYEELPLEQFLSESFFTDFLDFPTDLGSLD